MTNPESFRGCSNSRKSSQRFSKNTAVGNARLEGLINPSATPCNAMNLKFASRSSLGYSMALFVAASVLISLSVFGKNSPAYNRAFNACSKQMEDAYADCLNKPYNGVEMCQNVASGVYKRCMRAKGFYAREGEVPPV